MVAKKVSKRASTTTKTKAAKKPKKMVLESFKVAKDTPPFFTFKISRQTVYWTVLVAFIIVMQLSILSAQMQVIQSTDALNSQLLDSSN